MIFVDTGAWVAYVSPDDQYHQMAARWMGQNRQPLVTTDYVADEALTLLKARGEPVRAEQLGALLFGTSMSIPAGLANPANPSSLSSSGRPLRLYYLTQEDILAAWQLFNTYKDKEWSFTDCTSKVVIEKLNLAHAFAFDQHFRQFGTVTVVP